MTIRHLTIFLTVAQTGSITKAAQQLYLSQPTVSVAIRELEKHYGIRLFERISQRLKITEDGKRFYGYASHLVSLFEDMEKMFGNADSQGELRVGASVTIGVHYIPDLVNEFCTLYPNIRVRVQIDASEEIERAILNNRLDFAVIEGVIHSEYLTAQPLLQDRLIAVCAPDHPFTKQDEIPLHALANEPLLLREVRSGSRELFVQALAMHGLEIIPVWQSTSVSALKQAAKKKIGIAILPEKLVFEELEQGQLCAVTIQDFSIERTIRLIYHKNKFVSKAMQCFMELATKNITH